MFVFPTVAFSSFSPLCCWAVTAKAPVNRAHAVFISALEICISFRAAVALLMASLARPVLAWTECLSFLKGKPFVGTLHRILGAIYRCKGRKTLTQNDQFDNFRCFFLFLYTVDVFFMCTSWHLLQSATRWHRSIHSDICPSPFRVCVLTILYS